MKTLPLTCVLFSKPRDMPLVSACVGHLLKLQNAMNRVFEKERISVNRTISDNLQILKNKDRKGQNQRSLGQACCAHNLVAVRKGTKTTSQQIVFSYVRHTHAPTHTHVWGTVTSACRYRKRYGQRFKRSCSKTKKKLSSQNTYHWWPFRPAHLCR